jgi:hypothetical protein
MTTSQRLAIYTKAYQEGRITWLEYQAFCEAVLAIASE